MRQRLRLAAIAAVLLAGALWLARSRAAPPPPTSASRLALAPCQLAHPFLATRVPASTKGPHPKSRICTAHGIRKIVSMSKTMKLIATM